MLSRLSQQLGEKVGSAAKTQTDEVLQQQMEQAESTLKAVSDVIDGFSKILQPDTVARLRGSFKPSGKYEHMFVVLTTGGSNLHGTPYIAGDMAAAGHAMKEIGIQEGALAEHFEHNTLKHLKQLRHGEFVQEYGNLKKGLEKRRLEMDRLKNSKKKEGDLTVATMTYQEVVENMFSHLDKLPGFQTEFHGVITDFLGEMREYHVNAAEGLKAATAQMESNVKRETMTDV